MSQATVELREVPVESVRPNPHQPRTDFDQGQLDELAASVRKYGVQSPIRVRVIKPEAAEAGQETFELIAGERRLRAAKLAGLTCIPALVGDVEDAHLLRLALVENIQRTDLGPIDEAKGYKALLDEEGDDLEAVVAATGKSKVLIQGRLNLLQLPAEVQVMVDRRELSLGCAEMLCDLSSPKEVVKYAKLAVRLGLSPVKLKARIQHVPRKKGGIGDGGRKKKITGKTISGALINTFNMMSEADVSNLTPDDRATLCGQIQVLREELGRFERELGGTASA